MSRCKVSFLLCLPIFIASLCSCSLIDDNLDGTTSRTIDCRLQISSGVDSLLANQLSGVDGQMLRETLSAYFTGLLYPSTRNISFNFYDAETGELCQSNADTMRGQNGSFTMQLPYGDLDCVASTSQPDFSGRMLMPKDVRTHTLTLYPSQAQVAMVSKVDSTITDVQVTVEGCASAFNTTDSTYTYDDNTVQSLPYQNAASTTARHTYTAPVLPSNGTLSWRMVVLATTASGSVTRTVLTVNKPLQPGDIRILLTEINSKGVVLISDTSVGATVILDWKKGGDYNPTI